VHSSQSIEAGKLSMMRLMEAIQRPGAGIDDLEQVVRSDVGLTYKLLRFINSAWFGLRHKVGSVRHALSWLGAIETRKWVSMVTLRGLGEDGPSELLVQALTRARLGELLSEKVGHSEYGSDLFLIGLLSVLDALLDMSIEEILEKVPVNESVRNALLGQEGSLSAFYQTILRFEQGDWTAFSAAAASVPIDEGLVPAAYREALEWAESALAST
jgi:c-di-GMP-related signal transduction protein